MAQPRLIGVMARTPATGTRTLVLPASLVGVFEDTARQLGDIPPEQLFETILVSFIEGSTALTPVYAATKEPEASPELPPLLLDDLELSLRLQNALARGGMQTTAEVFAHEPRAVRELACMTDKTWRELLAALSKAHGVPVREPWTSVLRDYASLPPKSKK